MEVRPYLTAGAAIVATGALGVVWAAVWVWHYRAPREHRGVSESELALITEGREAPAPGQERPAIPWLEMLRHRNVLAVSLGYFCITFVEYFFITWFPSYLVQDLGFTLLQLGVFGTIPAFSAILGQWSGGYVADALVRRGLTVTRARKSCIVGGALTSSVIAVAAFVRSPGLALALLSISTAALTFARRGAWIPPLIFIVIVAYLSGAFSAASSGVLESPFQRACEETNIMNVWHESVPERAGVATSDLALPGCTVGLGLGQFHFVDSREFAYFLRPARARAQLATSPATLAPNVPTILTFTLRDYQGNPVQGLVFDHNRILHVVIASQDFSVFSHIHVEDFGPVTPEVLKTGKFPVRFTFPKPGYYLVSVDYTERAYIFSDQFYLNVEPSAAMSAIKSENLSLQENIDGYKVTLQTSPARLKAGAPATLDYHVEKDGKPLTEMNPYLAVPMHISIIRDDLMGFLHIHGLLPVSPIGKLLGENIHASHLFLPNKFGPDIEATNFTFPSTGVYHIFGEFSVAGKIVVSQFTVSVE